MKQGGLFVAGLILAITMFCVPVYADDVARNIISHVLDSFDDPNIGWTWSATGSKFITTKEKKNGEESDLENPYPRVAYFEHVPLAIKNLYNDPNTSHKVLGVQAQFDRQGDNWLDIFPVDSDGKPYEIPLPGIVSRIDLWVWGANFNYMLEVLIRDSYGIVHTLDMGSLSFSGWHNLFVNVPTSIPQLQRYLPRYRGMALVGLRVRTHPSERVNDYKIFFDQLKIVTDMHQSMFDGYELTDVTFDDANSNSNASSTANSAEGAN